jgi:hypothetical protein
MRGHTDCSHFFIAQSRGLILDSRLVSCKSRATFIEFKLSRASNLPARSSPFRAVERINRVTHAAYLRAALFHLCGQEVHGSSLSRAGIRPSLSLFL